MKRIIFILTLFITSCEEVVVINLPDPQNLVVVEGWVTNILERQYIRISKSNGFSENSLNNPIQDASVVIQTRFGDTFIYTHTEDGNYISNQVFSGTAGTEYRVRILLSNGEEIRSEWEKMPPIVEMIDLTVESFQENDPNNSGQQLTVYFPKIRALDPVAENNFYRWVFFKNRELFTDPESITLQDDRFFNGNLIPNSFQAFSYDREDEIIVQFQSINSQTFDFLKLLKSQITTLGTSGGTTPAVVNGNLSYMSDANSDVVLGYFGTTAISADTILVQ